MATHEQFADDLALFAMGALEEGECDALEAHLQSCPACRRELDQYRADSALLGLSALGPQPPQRSRTRLLEAVAAEPRRRPRLFAISHARPWWAIAPMLASLALVVVGFLLWREARELKQENEELAGQIQENQKDVERAKLLVGMFTAPDVQRVTLIVNGEQKPKPQIRAFYQSRTGRLMFIASNLDPLPADKAYEMWIIPASGAPIPAGVFKPDEHGSAMVVNPPVAAGTMAKTFAITVESEAGSPTPTSTPILVGAGV